MPAQEIKTLSDVQRLIAATLRRASDSTIDAKAAQGLAAAIIADLKAGGIKLVRSRPA